MVIGVWLACVRPVMEVESLPQVPEPVVVPSSPGPPSSLYLVMVDRFANGDSTNDWGVDLDDPQAWHGGDIAGVAEHLDWIAGLGVGAVWLTPVASSRWEPFGEWGAYHGYWVKDLGATEPRFGQLDDLETLQQGLEAREMELVLDLVWNHVAFDSPLREEHPDWFHEAGTITDWSDPVQREHGQVHGLPDLNQDHPEVYEYLLHNTRWWMEQSGATGIRVDAVGHMPAAFLRRIQHDLEGRYWSVGEIFEGSAPLLAAAWAETGLPAVFDFPLHHAMVDVLCGGAPLGRLAATLSQDRFYVDPSRLVTFLDNHDTPRIASACGGDVDRVASALRFLLAMRGVPAITWGTELPLEGGKEPDSRRDMDFTAAPQLADTIREGLAMRADQPVFGRGTTRTVVLKEDLWVLMRQLGDEIAFVAVNRGEAQATGLPAGLGPDRVPGGQVSVWLPMPAEGVAATWLASWEGVRQVRFVDVPEGWRVVGSAPELGGWNPGAALQQEQTELPVGEVASWKLVRVDATGEVEWEDHANRDLHVVPGDGVLEVRP